MSRTWAPAATLGFRGFSPFAPPNVIEVSDIAFDALFPANELPYRHPFAELYAR